MKVILVVDIGTSSVRTVLTGENKEIFAIVQRKRSVGICLDAELEWNGICEMIRQLINENEAVLSDNPIAAVAVSALVGWVGVNRQGHALTPCYTYMHKEKEQFQEMSPLLDVDKVFQVCGRMPAPEWMAYKLSRIKKEEPELYQKLAVLTSLKDFINMKLCGEFAIDHTSAGYTLLYDIRKERWNDELINCFGIHCSKLPELKRPWEKLGMVKPVLAAEFSLKNEVPVVVGSCDGSTAILGAGGVCEKTAVSVMGTTEVLFLVAKDWNAKDNRGLIVNPHVIPGYWLIGGPMGMYGGTVEWLGKNVLNGTRKLEELSRLAKEIKPGCEGLTILPNLAGTRAPYWNSNCVGTMMGLTMEHRAEHLLRGIMEANGFDCREILERAEQIGAECAEIIAIGGGASNDLWLTIKAAVTGLPVWRTAVTEATVAGSAVLALDMLGIKEKDGSGMKRKLFAADREQKEQYSQLYLEFKERREAAAKLYQ